MNDSLRDKQVFVFLFSTVLLCAVALLPVPLAWAQSGAEASVQNFGAVGDGKTLNTAAIQKAVETVAGNGGGTVLFPAGTYLSGTIYLRSHVTLHLQAGAVLLGSTRIEDFPVNFCKYPSYTDRYCVRALIWAEGVENVAITGRGVIDGQGAAFLGAKASEEELKEIENAKPSPNRHTPHPNYAKRPYIIRMTSCRDILIEGVTMQNSPMWMQHYLDCSDMTVRGIRVINQVNRNNDMIDIDSSRNVVIQGCYGDTDDDALTLKSTGPDPTENIVISDCILRSHVNAIKMGTESTGGFRNITITNCVILRSEFENHMAGSPEGFAGIALEAVDGGTLERITISNIAMNGIATPLFMRLGNRARLHTSDAPKPAVGAFRDINVDNIVATGVENISCSISGIPGHPIQGVRVSNMTLRCTGGIDKDLTDLEVPEVVTKYPESRMFGPLPSYGFYCRHVENLTFRNVQVGFDRPDRRYALVCDDVKGLTLDSFQPMVAKNAPAAILLNDVRQTVIRDCNPPTMETFVRLRGDTEEIQMVGNLFKNVENPTKRF